jgi:hypothetical protein
MMDDESQRQRPGSSDRNDPERLAHFQWLADRAWGRFTNRRTYEWHANFSLWAAIGSISYVLFTGPLLVPGDRCRSVVLVAVAAVVVLVVYAGIWTPWLHTSNTRDQATSYHWEKAVVSGLGAKLPIDLRPLQCWGRHRKAKRHRVRKTAPPSDSVCRRSWRRCRKNLRRWKTCQYIARCMEFWWTSHVANASAVAQVVFTLLILCLPVVAVLCGAHASTPTDTSSHSTPELSRSRE